MIEFMVMEKTATGEWKGLGCHSFAALPRTGEYIEFDDENHVAQMYQVIAVLHPLDPSGHAGDLVLKYISTSVDFRTNL